MPSTVSLDKLRYSGLPEALSFEAKAGERVMVVTSREDESSLLLGLLTGLIQPDSGALTMAGISIRNCSQNVLMQLRSRIGVVPFNGGLVSNLKVWENIFLPYQFHKGSPVVVDEETAENLLIELGYSGRKMTLPAHLSLYDKIVVAFVRAAVMKPEIIIYCNILDNISALQRSRLSGTISRYHSEINACTQIFLTSSTASYSELHFDTVFHTRRQPNS